MDSGDELGLRIKPSRKPCEYRFCLPGVEDQARISPWQSTVYPITEKPGTFKQKRIKHKTGNIARLLQQRSVATGTTHLKAYHPVTALLLWPSLSLGNQGRKMFLEGG